MSWKTLLTEDQVKKIEALNENTHRDAIVQTAIGKYVKSGGDIDIDKAAKIEDTVDGDYWVEAWVLVHHEEVFRAKKKE